MKKGKVKLEMSDAERAMTRLMRVGDRVWRASDERFGRWQMTDNHYNVLRILNGSDEPLRQVEIGRRMLSTRANVTKLIDALEGRGFVRRLPCTDRRAHLIELTAAGAAFLRETAAEILGFAEASMKALSRQEQRTLFALLGKLLDEETED